MSETGWLVALCVNLVNVYDLFKTLYGKQIDASDDIWLYGLGIKTTFMIIVSAIILK